MSPHNENADEVQNRGQESQSYRILHQDNFKIVKVLTESSQASIFIGKLENLNGIQAGDIKYVKNLPVVLKQFQLKKERSGFKKELKILKKIKSLELAHNGGFPVIISAKLSNTLGEILMSYAGPDIFDVFNIAQSLEDPASHKGLSLSEISDLGM